jgi:hypothetical protein
MSIASHQGMDTGIKRSFWTRNAEVMAVTVHLVVGDSGVKSRHI